MTPTDGTGGAFTRPFADAAGFDDWLSEHHGHRPGVWLVLARAGRGIASMSADEAVDVGLCWGWVSGQRRSLDDDYFQQKYVPRRPRSRWSQVNVRRVALLSEAGRMQPPGLAEVAAARADGRWAAAYASKTRTEQYLVALPLLTTLDADRRAELTRRTVAHLSGDTP